MLKIDDLVVGLKLQNKITEQQKKKIEEQGSKLDEQEKMIIEQNKIINEQGKKINELVKKIEFFEKENNEIKNELKDIIKELKSHKEKEKILVQTEKINPIINSQSKIINFDSFKQLNNWINPLKSLKFELIFTASINGDKSNIFHKFCDGKGPTVTVVKGENEYIFGGYVTVPFSSDGQSYYDDKALLFSLTNMKKFPVKIKEQAVCHLIGWGPYLGYKNFCDLAIFPGCLSNNGSYSDPKSYEFNRVDLIGTSKKNFGVEDYEVYLVDIN